MKPKTKRTILHISALTVDILPPVIATIAQFPVWIETSSEATVSGLAVLMLFFCALPFVNQIKEWLKNPSVPIMWAVIYVVFCLLQNIIDQIVIVAFIGLISNVVGTGLYKWGDIYNSEGNEKETE